jgi:hypothetical protein
MMLRYAALVPLSVAFGCAWTVWRHVRTRREAARWPVATGRVVHSRVAERRFTVGSRCSYGPQVIYEFRARKQTVRSEGLTPEGAVFTSSRERAEREVACYPVGAKVRVRYDLADPRRSFLADYGSGLGIWMWGIAGVGFAGAAGLMWSSL